MRANETRDVRLLGRRAATGDDGGELGGEFDEVVPEVFDTELRGHRQLQLIRARNGKHLERLAVDNEAAVELRLKELELVASFGRGFDYTNALTSEGGREGEKERTLGDLVDVLIPRDELGRDSDTSRRLNLVPREHPDLDPGVP